MDALEAAALELWDEARRSVRPLRDHVGRFPWYDSTWLSRFVRVRDYLAAHDPDGMAAFLEEIARLRISPGTFAPMVIDEIVNDDMLQRIQSEVSKAPTENLEKHERAGFGRDVIHDNPLFLDLQSAVTDRVAEIVGEELETSYNFLSLYASDGRCPVHMDAPDAKWTLDICVDQSRKWPIFISEIVDWPERWTANDRVPWEQQIRNEHTFGSYELEPGQALVFGGSSQWHYRDRMIDAAEDDFCTLLFFHFVPKHCGELVGFKNWPDRFGVPPNW